MEDFLASIYKYIYLLGVAILTLQYLPVYQKQTYIVNIANRSKTNNGVLLLLVVILFIGFRPLNEQYFDDMWAYSYMLRMNAEEIFEFNWDVENKIFDNFIVWFGSKEYDQRIFFVLMSVCYFGCIYLGIKRIFPNDIKISFLTYLAGLSTFSYAVNGMKAGVAASIFILALSFKDKKLICFILMLISLGVHHSMVLPIATCIIVFFIKNPKFYYGVWFFCLLMCVLHITYFQGLFASMSDEQGAIYLSATSETTNAHIGFRPDFILYSAVPVILGYKYEIENKHNLSLSFQFLMHFYILTNAVWMLCMYASFNNRIAYLSWFVYPIILIYPFLDKLNTDPYRYQKLSTVVKYHLFFTLFMLIIYVGLFSL